MIVPVMTYCQYGLTPRYVERIGNATQEQHADQGPPDVPPATAQRRTADNDRGYYVDFLAVTYQWVPGAQIGIGGPWWRSRRKRHSRRKPEA